MKMCLRVLKESNKSRFDSYSHQEYCIDHIPYYLSGLLRAHFFRQPFSKELYTNWFVSIRANYFLRQELNTQNSTKKFNNVITYQQQQQQQQFIQFLNNLPQLAELFYKVSKKM